MLRISLYLFYCAIQAIFTKKRYKLKIDSVEENNKEKGEGGKGKEKKTKGENKGKHEKNKAAFGLPY